MVISLVRYFMYAIWIFDYVAALPRALIRRIIVVAGLLTVISISVGFVLHTSSHLQEFFDGLSPVSVVVIPPGIKTKSDLPKKISEIESPFLSADAAFVVDRKNSKVLYDLKSKEKLAPASTTKLMTALVSLDIYKLDDELTVPVICTSVEGTKTYLPAGKIFKVNDLLYSLLVSSSADAACVLSNGKMPYKDFIRLMNEKALVIGMSDTFFTNPIGLDGVDGGHYSTAEDLYRMAVVAMGSEVVKDIVKTKEYVIKSVDGSFSYNLVNTNKLLWEIPQTVGVKTGTTVAAGEVLIYEFADEKKDIVIVVMGSKDRFTDTKALLTWTLSSYSWD